VSCQSTTGRITFCTLDEVLYRFQQIRYRHGGEVGVMVSFDGAGKEAMVTRLPVNSVKEEGDAR
jgi:hypothetical protein